MTEAFPPPASPSQSDELVARCIQCDSSFTKAQLDTAHIAGVKGCPSCGAHSPPVHPKNDVQVKVNTHELRILTIWASNWAARPDIPPHSKKSLQCIIQRLREQLPDVPLTMADEVRDLQNAGYKAELVSSDGAVIVPKKPVPS